MGFHRVGCYEEVEKNLGVEVDTLEDTVVSVYSAKNGDLLQKGLERIAENYGESTSNIPENAKVEMIALAEKYYPTHYLFLDTSQASKGFIRYEAVSNPHFNSYETFDITNNRAEVNFKGIKICQYANLIALRKPVPEKSFTANALQLDFDETNVSPTLSFKDIPIIDGYTTPDAIVVALPDVKDKELKSRPEQETIFDKNGRYIKTIYTETQPKNIYYFVVLTSRKISRTNMGR